MDLKDIIEVGLGWDVTNIRTHHPHYQEERLKHGAPLPFLHPRHKF